MRIWGWILTVFGSSGLIGTLIARDSSSYRKDRLAKDLEDLSNKLVSKIISISKIIDVDRGFHTTVNILFYISIVVLILGIVFLIVGYNRNVKKEMKNDKGQENI